ncbi:unnamed protein product [Pedinophyceae sp. YPF-701]|nr:unnamed protein product [Pedinophyceae sp. YPF-701]
MSAAAAAGGDSRALVSAETAEKARLKALQIAQKFNPNPYQAEPEPEREPTPPRENSQFGPDPLRVHDARKIRAFLMSTRTEQINKMLNNNNLPIPSERNRSPSPPPVYDPDTHMRMNSREQRVRAALEQEKKGCLQDANRYDPVGHRLPSAFKPPLKEVKLFIPEKEHPGYNFIGLILGPRGNTQKRMVAETGASITIRGKGSVKEGAKVVRRPDGRLPEGWNEECHVHISADTWSKVDRALELVEPLLTPVDEDKNVHKRRQLMELAKMNGTIDVIKFSTPEQQALALVHGPAGEPGAEPIYRLPAAIQAKAEEQYRKDVARFTGQDPGKMEDEYRNFLAELGGQPLAAKGQVHYEIKESEFAREAQSVGAGIGGGGRPRPGLGQPNAPAAPPPPGALPPAPAGRSSARAAGAAGAAAADGYGAPPPGAVGHRRRGSGAQPAGALETRRPGGGGRRRRRTGAARRRCRPAHLRRPAGPAAAADRAAARGPTHAGRGPAATRGHAAAAAAARGRAGGRDGPGRARARAAGRAPGAGRAERRGEGICRSYETDRKLISYADLMEQIGN